MKRILSLIAILACLMPLRAQTAFSEANEAYAQGNYVEAVTGYEQAHSRRPSP